MHRHPSMFGHAASDGVAGIVVFLVALPLCLGIAVACGVPPISGLMAGVIGGLLIPWISRSPLSVSGPAAGLTSIVLAEIAHLGGLPPFLTAVIIAGGLQAAFGLLRAGRLADVVPSAVVKGMLAAIGITIVLKQLPAMVGATGSLMTITAGFHPGAAAVGALSLLILYGWKRTPLARLTFASPALVVVIIGSALAQAFSKSAGLALAADHFVRVPPGGLASLAAALPRPDLTAFAHSATWITGVTVAVVASIETLLSLQAVDRLDPLRRHSPPDRELLAQGLGNIVCGLVGALPVTAVIIRSGANVAAGARERFSALVHGLLLLVAVLAAGPLLNRIPLPCLAAVLIQVGLSLARPALFRLQARLGWSQFLPFVLTIAAVLAFDLLKGVVAGVVIGIGFVLYENSRRAVVAERDAETGILRIRFRRDGTFVSKPGIVAVLDEVDDGERVEINGADEYIDHDVKEVLARFRAEAAHRQITVTIRGVDMTHAEGTGGH